MPKKRTAENLDPTIAEYNSFHLREKPIPLVLFTGMLHKERLVLENPDDTPKQNPRKETLVPHFVLRDLLSTPHLRACIYDNVPDALLWEAPEFDAAARWLIAHKRAAINPSLPIISHLRVLTLKTDFILWAEASGQKLPAWFDTPQPEDMPAPPPIVLAHIKTWFEKYLTDRAWWTVLEIVTLCQVLVDPWQYYHSLEGAPKTANINQSDTYRELLSTGPQIVNDGIRTSEAVAWIQRCILHTQWLSDFYTPAPLPAPATVAQESEEAAAPHQWKPGDRFAPDGTPLSERESFICKMIADHGPITHVDIIKHYDEAHADDSDKSLDQSSVSRTVANLRKHGVNIPPSRGNSEIAGYYISSSSKQSA